MPSVAEQLRTARESRNLTVNEVAETTKIRGDHIRALEEGNYNVFVAPVYIRGFVRCYATLLKLDVPAVMKALDAELGKTEKFAEPPPLTLEKKTPLDFVMLQLSKLSWRRGGVVIAGLLIVVVIVLIIWWWNSRQTSRPINEPPPAKYRSSQSGERLPLTNAPARRQ